MNTSDTDKNILYGLCRFKNINGITCYINSILHILQIIPIFSDFIIMGTFAGTLVEKFKEEDAIKNTVMFQLYKLFKISLSNDDFAITPTAFKNVIGQKDSTWNEFNHQDSQQFLTFLISTLEEEIGYKVDFIPGSIVETPLKDIPISNLLAQMAWENHQKREYSPLKDIFNGMTVIKNKCSCCSNISSNFEPFNTLQLAIPIKNLNIDKSKDFSLEDCLAHLIEEEQLDKDESTDCDLCGFKNRKFKTINIWRTPKVLIFHIKRFQNDNSKLTNNIKYPIYDLDISKYICDESPHKDKAKYNLIGINIHQEFGHFGTNSGHYTSLLKNRFDNNWYLFNDGNKPIPISNEKFLQNNSAYLLFYYRTN